MLFSQGFKIDTDHGTEFISDKMICNGRHWTEVEGKANIQKFLSYGMTMNLGVKEQKP